MANFISGLTAIVFSLHDTALYTTSSQIRPLFISCTILLITQNILTTCLWSIHSFRILILMIALIVHRIWLVERAAVSDQKQKSYFQRVIRIIVESGMICTIPILQCLLFLLTDSTAIYIAIREVCLLFPGLVKKHLMHLLTGDHHHRHHLQFNHYSNAPHFVGIQSTLH